MAAILRLLSLRTRPAFQALGVEIFNHLLIENGPFSATSQFDKRD